MLPSGGFDDEDQEVGLRAKLALARGLGPSYGALGAQGPYASANNSPTPPSSSIVGVEDGTAPGGEDEEDVNQQSSTRTNPIHEAHAKVLEGKEATRQQMLWLRNTVIFAVVAISCVLLANTIASRSRGSDGLLSTLKSSYSKFKDTSQTSWGKSTKPNIIFMLADDLGYNSMGYSDTTDLQYSTPFMTELANKGIKLSNYYAMEVCTPSRASLLTGRYPLSMGIQFNDATLSVAWALNDTETLLPEVLRGAGYSTYMLGKWNIGHFSPRFLPTARGFDYFVGFLTGETYYWSKFCPQHKGIRDFMYADTNCYYGYDGPDMHEYSTFFYRDKAVKIIYNHDYDDAPLFMYLAFQGVHDPFHDYNEYSNGIPKTYVTSDEWDNIHTSVVGLERRQYALALKLMDDSVKKITLALKQADQLDNTVIIFTSDNGGCVLAGGRNGDLRGSKGTLFEGGTKVDAFIYSPLIEESVRGRDYSPVFHVSDWMPTLLDLAGVSYTPSEDFSFDGVSHADNLLAADDDIAEVRTSMLYNLYTNINSQMRDGSSWNMWSTSPLAIRNSQYKLIHAYDDNSYSGWYSQTSKDADDDNSLAVSATCSQTDTLTGNYTMFLFDLINDPNETTNLYDDETYEDIKTDFYSQLIKLAKNSKADKTTWDERAAALPTFVKAGGYVVPWVTEDRSSAVDPGGYWPEYCRSDSLVAPSDNDDYSDMLGFAAEDDSVSLIGDDDDAVLPERNDDLIDTSPTLKPTLKPTQQPSYSTNYTPPPTAVPSPAPTGPTLEPSKKAPVSLPTYSPTLGRTLIDTLRPTNSKPTPKPSAAKPTMKPTSTYRPTNASPTQRPTNTFKPSAGQPTQLSTSTQMPSAALPTQKPNKLEPTEAQPTTKPSQAQPTMKPTQAQPTMKPSLTGPTSVAVEEDLNVVVVVKENENDEVEEEGENDGDDGASKVKHRTKNPTAQPSSLMKKTTTPTSKKSQTHKNTGKN